MIGSNRLGLAGRLGNQMFQCAALLGIAAKRGFDYMIPDHSQYTDYGNKFHHELQACFKLPDFQGKYGYIKTDKTFCVEQYHFDQNAFTNCPDNVSLEGLYESEKYFKHIEDKIRKNYEFKDIITEKCLEYGKYIFRKNPVAIHIRRGDLLTPNHHLWKPLCTIDYYERAIKKFDSDRCFLVFSDDTEWCKQQKVFQAKNIGFAEPIKGIHQGHTDLCLLSMCSDFIIANSTFSWWGAWLCKNKTKKVFAPTTYFGPSAKHWNIKDQIPESWNRI